MDDLNEIRQNIQMIFLDLSLEVTPKLKLLVHHARVLEEAANKLENIESQNSVESRLARYSQLIREHNIRAYEHVRSIRAEMEQVLSEKSNDKNTVCLYLKAWRGMLNSETSRILAVVVSAAELMKLSLKHSYRSEKNADHSAQMASPLEEIITIAAELRDRLKHDFVPEPQFDC